jgi:hypothetical protein
MPWPFRDSASAVGPPLDAGGAMVRRAEDVLGVRLPASYVAALRAQNGGYLQHTCCPTGFRSTWAPDHIGVDMLYGIGAGNEWGIDHDLGSRYLIAEWDYPDIGVVAFGTPSGGHDTVMLDYTNLGPDGEPTVAYVDEDRVPRTISSSFAEFLAVLRPESDYSDD